MQTPAAAAPTLAERFKPRNTVDEFCEISGLSRATVYERIKAGLLHVTKDGARTFITGAEIERYLAACERSPGQIAYEAQIAKQCSRETFGGAHSFTWPAWEKTTDEVRARWNDADWRAQALAKLAAK